MVVVVVVDLTFVLGVTTERYGLKRVLREVGGIEDRTDVVGGGVSVVVVGVVLEANAG